MGRLGLKFFGDVPVSSRVKRGTSALGALTDASGEFFDVIEDLVAFGHLCANLFFGIHDCRVVATECLADLGQGEIGEFAAQIHRDLT